MIGNPNFCAEVGKTVQIVVKLGELSFTIVFTSGANFSEPRLTMLAHCIWRQRLDRILGLVLISQGRIARGEFVDYLASLGQVNRSRVAD